MTEINTVVEFDYNLEKLNEIVENVNNQDLTDLEKVSELYKKIKKVRTSISSQEKEFVSEANAYKNKVFDKRKEYFAIIVPVEEKLKGIIEDEEKKVIIQARKSLLPEKISKIKELGFEPLTDEEYLEMDEKDWATYLNSKIGEKREKEERAGKEKEMLEKAKKEGIEQEKRKQEEKIKAEKEEAEKKEKEEREEKEKLESDKVYKNFLKENNFNEETDIIKKEDREVKIYRIVNTLKI